MRYLIIAAALAVAGCDDPQGVERHIKTITAFWEIELIPSMEYDPPPFNPSADGIRDAARRHDALARRKYAKPFKWFKFNMARRATAK